MNKKLIRIAYRMERQAERMIKQARQLREMAAEEPTIEPIIKIEAANLQPEVESFMWKILDKMQKKINGEPTIH